MGSISLEVTQKLVQVRKTGGRRRDKVTWTVSMNE